MQRIGSVIATFILLYISAVTASCGGPSSQTNDSGGEGGAGGSIAEGGSSGKAGSGGGAARGGSGGSTATGGSGGSTATGGKGGSNGNAVGGSGGIGGSGLNATATRPEPILYLKMDDGSGFGAVDSSGLDHKVSVKPPEIGSAWVTGKMGGGIAFDGTNWLTVRTSPYLDGVDSETGTGQVTLAAWVYPTAFDTKNLKPMFIVGRQIGTTTGNQFGLALVPVSGKAGHLGAFFGPFGGLSAPDGALPLNTWTHVAVTYDGITAVLYTNGQKTFSSAVVAEMPPERGPVIVGGDINSASGVSELFVGSLDEVRIYNRVLSDAEIAGVAKP
ncbi:MAG: LamG domain-containing protein [Deltaproteobacteria bacterium]|nr:LamG domain-containing protein [Deltaproteobacteria bacterium]